MPSKMEETIRKRREILRRMIESSQSKPELVSGMTISRSTISRGISELLEHDCITRTDSKFEATETGRLAFEAYNEYCRAVETLDASSDVLNGVPVDTIDHVFLREADVEVVDSRQPWKVFKRCGELIKSATSLKGTVPVITPQYFVDIIDTLDDGLDVELVWDCSLYDSLDEEEHKVVTTLKTHERVTITQANLSESHALWITDSSEGRHAGITVYADGWVKGVVRNSTCAAVDWALDQYRRRKLGDTFRSAQKQLQ